MKQKKIFINVIVVLLLSLGFISCNTEDRKIKKALKEYSTKESSNYKLSEYRIVETILKSNLEDSISNSKISIAVAQRMMKTDSLLLNKYISQREQCKSQKRNTLYYLASTYDDLIDDWQKMVDEKEEDLNKKQKGIDEINIKIENWKKLIRNSETPIIYYVIKYRYVLDKKQIEKTISLSTDYKIL